MNENEIKNKLKSDLSSYEIKTSSSDILRAYKTNLNSNKVNEKRRPFYKTFLAYSLPIAATILIAVGLGANFIHKPIDPPNPIKPSTTNTYQNQTAFSIFSGMNMIEGMTSTTTNTPSKFTMKKEKITPSSFNSVVDEFDPCLDVIDSLLNNSINIDSTVEEGNFIGKYGNYPYKLNVDEYTLYTNIELDEDDDEDEDEVETEYVGEVYIDELTSYKVKINLEKELNSKDAEEEIEMTIYYSETNYLTIEQELELDERTYEYSLFENDELLYSRSISFENECDINDSISIEIVKNDEEFNFEDIRYENDILLVNYEYLDDEDSFEMKAIDNQRVYTNSKNEKIIK